MQLNAGDLQFQVMKFNYYTFLFYKFYLWSYNAHGKSDLPELNSILLISFFTGCNVMTLILIIDILFPTNIVSLLGIIAFNIVFALVVLGIHYFFLLRKAYHNKIIKYYGSLDADLLKSRVWILYLYLFLSIFTPVMLLIINY